MLMQNFGVRNKEHYGMLQYFLEWSIAVFGAVTVMFLKVGTLGDYDGYFC